MDSRSLAFADQILEATNGEGVHVVLNSLAGDFIPASIRTLAAGGRFLELGKRDIWSPEAVAKVRPDVHYYVYDLGAEAQADRGLLRPMLDEILAALAEGSLRPLPVTVFPLDGVRDAMRFMAQARHVGKIVVRVAADTGSGTSTQLRPTEMATYWITGGLGALGLETARWLVQRGARHLVLSGRRPPGTAAEACIREFEQLGVTVRVFQADAADRDRMQFVLDEIRRSLPPLRGVVHAAGAVRDAVLMNQRWAEGRETLRGKVDGAWILHEITRDIPLEFFVLYSAAGVLLGAAGQGMYPAANAELDALACVRRRLGLPALSVAWGPWAGAGMAADLAARGRDVWQDRGLGKIEPAAGFAQLERLLADGATYCAVIPIRWAHFLAQLPAGADRDFFSAVAPAPSLKARAAPPAQGAVILERLRALPLGQRRQELIAYLTERALHVLGLDATTPVEPRVPLKEMGLDSLMAVELSNSLVRSGGQSLPATLLFDYPTLDALATYLARAWRLEADAADAIGTATADVGQIHERRCGTVRQRGRSASAGRARVERRRKESMMDVRSTVDEPLTPIKRALLEIRDLRARLAEAETLRCEPIAIVGMGIRFPGGACDAESFAQLLWSGEDAVTQIPADRWSLDALYAADPDAPGKMTTRHGAFLDAGRSVRRRVLWHLAARSGEHGSAAAPVIGGELGGARGCRPRSRRHCWHTCRRLSRHRQQRLRPRAVRSSGIDRSLFQHRQRLQCRSRSAVIFPRPAWAEHRGRHRLFVVPGCPASGVSGPPPRRVRPGAGRRGQSHSDPRDEHQLLEGADDGAGRPVQDLRRRGRRICARRGLRRRGAAATFRCPGRRRPHPRGGARQRNQPGWPQRRPDCPQWAGAGGGDSCGA